jgi:hemerythrin-like metal-binding protein
VVNRKGADGPQACASAVDFLKGYVVKHFSDEEALQVSLGFEGRQSHKLLHRDFVSTVLEYENKLTASNYDAKIMQQFTGHLLGWLIYHVVGEDRKITGMVAAGASKLQDKAQAAVYFFTDSACEVLGQMLNADFQTADTSKHVNDINDISVNINLIGDRKGEVEFVFPMITALRMVQSMTMMNLGELGDMMDSALREITNIISGNAASKLASSGYVCDITPPKLYRGSRPVFDNGKIIKSEFGSFTVFFSEKN